MSFELDHFPPKGSRWAWGSKTLTTSGWGCDLARQMAGASRIWPMAIYLHVDLVGGRYHWLVEVTDWKHKRETFSGESKTALKALSAAEEVGERAFHDLMPDWIRTALANGWRPPT